MHGIDEILCSQDVPQDWAKTFFDEGFEDTFDRLGKFNDTESNTDDIIRLLNLRNGSRILDIPCGFGRYSHALAQRGQRVTGVDASPALLFQARTRFRGAIFLEGDMRQPPGGPYDAVLNLWTSFGYFNSEDEDLDALRAWYSVLAPSGQLLMELTDRERAEYENRTAREVESIKITEINGVVEQAKFVWNESRAYIRYTCGTWSRVCQTRIYSQQELTHMLQSVGFSSIQVFGDFRKSKKKPQDRLVLLARKQV